MVSAVHTRCDIAVSALFLAIGLTGCFGVSVFGSEGSADPETPHVPGQAAPLRYSCDAAQTPSDLPLPRLSRVELEKTFQFAVAQANSAQADAIWSEVSAAVASYPPDVKWPVQGDLKGGYDRFDQTIQQTAVEASYGIAVEIAQALTSSSSRLGAMLGPCATDGTTSNDRSCLEAFIARWGSRVMRYPLSTEDITYYADTAGSTPVDPPAVADVIALVLTAPQTLYRVEHGTDNARQVAPLSAHELAARLSFHYWQSPPDDELWAAAQSGELLNPTIFDEQVQRLVSSPNARSTMEAFVGQWLRLEELPALDTLNDDAAFKAFAGAQLPPSSGRRAMIDDVSSSWIGTISAGGNASDFLKDKRSYAKDPFLSAIYGVSPWSGTDSAPLPETDKRAGLITRPAMLATGTVTTRPIHKGYLVRNALLCQQLGAPPSDVNLAPPTPTGNVTTREAVSALTGSGACAGCHATLINPPGFLTEGFDALGRERAEEKLFDSAGNVIASLPIRTDAVPAIVPGDSRTLSDGVELTQAIDESGLYHSCLATQYFRFSMRRPEAPAADGCMLVELETKARAGASLRELLKAVAVSPSFKTRNFQ